MTDTVLVIDDEAAVREVLSAYLERSGYRVVLARNGIEAAALFAARPPAFVILDLMLPGVDGWELLRRWRAEGAVPVLVLTARGEETDAIVGLRLGADDYVRKPFSPGEVVARVDSVLRRARRPPPAESGAIVRGKLTLDPDMRQAFLGAKPLDLTATEFELLRVLAGHPGRVYTREMLLSLVHGEAFPAYARAIDTHVKNLRRKLGDEAGRSRWIETVRGAGYRFVER